MVFTGWRKTGAVDLEAVDVAVRGAMHRAGAAALADVLATRGYLLGDLGRLDDAFRDYMENATILQPILAEESSNLQFRWLHARNAMEAGNLFLLKRETRRAAAHFKAAANLMRGMMKDPRHEISSLRSYALCLNWLAVAEFRQGAKLPEVRTLIDEALQVNRTALEQDPRNARTRNKREVILQNERETGAPAALTSQIPLH